MAAKMKCPNCGSICSQVGEHDKKSKFFYRIFDSVATLEDEAGEYRVLSCSVCGVISGINSWN